jgi:hypothetical protein
MALLETLVPSIGNASRRRAGQRLEPPAQLKARERRRFNREKPLAKDNVKPINIRTRPTHAPYEAKDRADRFIWYSKGRRITS